MRLKQFIAKDVRGYMKYDIKFRDSVTFLIGINGSGKTTVLKLLSGLLTPSYIDLCQIEYSKIELICESISDKSNIRIISEKEGNKFVLKYCKNGQEPAEGSFEYIEKTFNRRRFEPEYVNQEITKRNMLDFDQSQVVSKIKELKTPLFLGLNRRIVNMSGIDYFERESFERRRRFHLDYVLDSVDEALNDIQELFYSFIRQTAKSQSSLSDSFRKKVFAESFKTASIDSMPTIDYDRELQRLKKQKEEFNTAIERLGIKDESIQFSDFFDSIQETLKTLSSIDPVKELIKDDNKTEYFNALMSWILNSSQINRIDKIIQYSNEYTKRVSQLKNPINRFVDSANLFFGESDKTVTVNEQGDICIKINGTKKSNRIFELSSGEKQLLVILAHLSFHKRNQRSSIFIIDEPELSLHISWQEKFVDAILTASPDTQFIMATHAPAILAKPERKDWCEDLSIKL